MYIHLGEIVPAYFPMPQNPVEPGMVGMGAVSDYLNNDTIMYAGLGVLAVLLLGGAFGGGLYAGRRGRGSGDGGGGGSVMPRLRITGSARAV